MVNDSAGFPSYDPAEVVNDMDTFIAWEELWELRRGSSFSTNDHYVLARAFQWFSKHFPAYTVEFADVIQSLVDDWRLLWTGALEAHDMVKQQKWVSFIAYKYDSEALKESTDLLKLVWLPIKRKKELLRNDSGLQTK